jgi:hypothetical protein
VALFATGLGLELWSQSLQDDLVEANSGDAPPTGLEDRYDRASAASWLGVASGPVGVLAVLSWAAPQPQVPWWSWTLGAFGLGLAGVGIYQVAISDDCSLYGESPTDCLREKQTTTRGVLLLSAAIPLISLPIVHLVRRTPGERAPQVSAGALPGGGQLRVSGRF